MMLTLTTTRRVQKSTPNCRMSSARPISAPEMLMDTHRPMPRMRNCIMIIFIAPLIVATLCFFYGIASLYLCREQGAMKMIMIQFLILGMGLWVSISISGAEMGLADDILQFGVLFCTLLVVVSVNII